MSKRLRINIRIDDADMALAGFPFMDDQFVIQELYGDACVVEIDLADRGDTTAAQEQFLNTSAAVVGYSVEQGDLHNDL